MSSVRPTPEIEVALEVFVRNLKTHDIPEEMAFHLTKQYAEKLIAEQRLKAGSRQIVAPPPSKPSGIAGIYEQMPGFIAEGGYHPIPIDPLMGKIKARAHVTGDEREHKGVRELFVAKGTAREFFVATEVVPSRDLMRGQRRDGSWWEADSLVVNLGGWWKEVGAHVQGIDPYPDKLMKAFTTKVLAQGQFDDLEKIKTPEPGSQFDMNQLAVACVLTLNRAIDTINEMQERIDALEAEKVVTASATQEEGFSLPKLGSSYGDVREG